MIGNAFTGNKIWQKMSFTFFDAENLETYEELKAAYLNEIKAEGKITEELQQEFEQLKGYLFKLRTTSKGLVYETKEKENDLFEQFIKDWIAEEFAGKLTLTSVGDWVWIETKTREFSELLKKYGAKWSNVKRAWYWCPTGFGKFRRRKGHFNNVAEVTAHWGSAASDYFNAEEAPACPF